MARVKRNIQDGYDEPFAKRLRELIDKKGTSQSELAAAINVTRQAVNSYTLGNTVPNADVLVKLSKYFDVSTDYLLGLSDAATTDNDIKAICTYTGLSEKSIKILNEIKKFDWQDIRRIINTINFLIEDFNLIALDDEYETASFNESIIKKIDDYFFYGGKDKQLVYFTSNGKIISSEDELENEIEKEPYLSVRSIGSVEILDNLLLGEISNITKESKALFRSGSYGNS